MSACKLVDPDHQTMTKNDVKKRLQNNSHIMVVVDAEGATREFTTSEGATNAEAPEAQATAITADFIFRESFRERVTKCCRE